MYLVNSVDFAQQTGSDPVAIPDCHFNLSQGSVASFVIRVKEKVLIFGGNTSQ